MTTTQQFQAALHCSHHHLPPLPRPRPQRLVSGNCIRAVMKVSSSSNSNGGGGGGGGGGWQWNYLERIPTDIWKEESPAPRRSSRFISVAATNYSSSNSMDDDGYHVWWSSLISHLNLLSQLCRPFAVIGTVMAITSVSLLPLQTIADLSPTFFLGLLKALVPSVVMSTYVSAINQLSDVKIDKINKPDLPLASGNFSTATAINIAVTSASMSLGMGIMFRSPALLYALLTYFALGSIYSIDLPFMRWKKHAFLAATCIVIWMGIVVQLAYFIHMQKFVLGKAVVITRSLAFATFFMSIISAVMAFFKDIPDMDGDKDSGIQSLCIILGPERVFKICVNMMFIAYGTAVVVGATSSTLLSKLVTILGHCMLALVMWVKSQSVDLNSKESTESFYMFIWQLSYAEYILIHFIP